MTLISPASYKFFYRYMTFSASRTEFDGVPQSFGLSSPFKPDTCVVTVPHVDNVEVLTETTLECATLRYFTPS